MNLIKLKKHRYFFAFDSQAISEISIGDIMQIGPLTIEKARKIIDPEYYISQIGIVYLSIYLSCAHFVIAAETRILIQEKEEDEKKTSREYQLSQNYHLHSITLTAGIILLETNLLKHLVKSFKNHYGIDLEYQDAYF